MRERKGGTEDRVTQRIESDIDGGQRQRHGARKTTGSERGERGSTQETQHLITLGVDWCGHVTVCHCLVVRRATHTRCVSQPSRSHTITSPPPLCLPSSSATLQVLYCYDYEDTWGLHVTAQTLHPSPQSRGPCDVRERLGSATGEAWR